MKDDVAATPSCMCMPTVGAGISWWKKLVASTAESRTQKGPPEHIPDEDPEHIPYEILMQILVKIPAKQVARCRCVCKSWYALTSTRYYVELLLKKNNNHSIVVPQEMYDGDKEMKIFIVDCWGAKKKATLASEIILTRGSTASSNSYGLQILYSCNGIVVFLEKERRSPESVLYHHILLNPTTEDKLRIITQLEGWIYAIFFHPGMQKYCLLWGRVLDVFPSVEYKILVLEPDSRKPSQTKTSSWTKSVETGELDTGFFSYVPRRHPKMNPVIVNGCLYWMVGERYRSGDLMDPCCRESIMAFDPRKERFRAMPHPGPEDQWCKEDPRHERMHLVPTDQNDSLCLCECSFSELLINIWMVKDADLENGTLWNRKLWNRVHTVNIDIDIRRCPFRNRVHREDPEIKVQPEALVGGELLVEWPRKGLFSFNVERRKVKKLEEGSKYELEEHMYAHNPSLVPISNCGSEIWIES